MLKVIDFHTHIFPKSFEKHLPKRTIDSIDVLRNRLRTWMRPYTTTVHRTQPLLRFLPEKARKNIDLLASLAPLPNLMIESSSQDLLQCMDDASVDSAVIIAHPPTISNELILESAAKNSRFIAAVSIPKGTSRPASLLKNYVNQGAKLLKIHPCLDSEGPSSPRYKSLLKAASDLGIPVILHTGCIHAPLFYQKPELGKAELYAPWFKANPQTRFILAHMNFHEPQVALDLALNFHNIYVDTSWQPAETIGEAVRRIGAERVLFGSDWPIVGNNISVGRKRIEDALRTGLITQDQAELVLGKNAVQLLGLT